MPRFGRRPFVMLFVLGLLWGSAFSIARFVVRGGVSPVDYSFILACFPALILLGYCWYKGQLRALITNHPQHYFFVGLYGIVIPNTNKYWLAAHLPSGVLAIVVGVTPFFIYPLALLCREERFRLNRMAGVLLGGFGVLLLAVHHNLIGIQINRWLIASLLTPLSYAFGAVYVARYTPKDCNIVMLTTGMLACATLMLLPCLLLNVSVFDVTPFLNPSVDLVILLEMVLVTVGYILLFKIIKNYGSINYSVVDGVGAIIGILWGWGLFHEPISSKVIWAIACVILGAVLINSTRLSET